MPLSRTLPRLGLAATLAACLVVGVLASGNPAAAGFGDEPPNFVVVMTDDQRWNETAQMPAVRNHMGRRGTKFADAYATFPLCCPSRATFLTGQYAHNHGVLNNSPPEGGYRAFTENGAEDRTIAVALDDAGYATGHIGKYLNGYPSAAALDPVGTIPLGWDSWQAELDNRMFDWRLNVNGSVRRFGSTERDYQTDVYARKAVSFIRKASDSEPFFLSIATNAPHVENGVAHHHNPRPAPRHRNAFKNLPFPRSPSFDEADVSDKPSFIPQERLDATIKTRLRLRYRDRLTSLLAVDDLVRDVVLALREKRELGDTYVIFTSDNGYMLGEHRLRKKRNLYEESARVPLFIRGPEVPEGQVVESVAANVDLAGTILTAAEADPIVPVDGIDLVAMAQDPGSYADRAILLENAVSKAVRTSRYAYLEHGTDGNPGADEFELYDLAVDPYQLDNVLFTDPDPPVRDDLEDLLEDLRDCQGAGCN